MFGFGFVGLVGSGGVLVRLGLVWLGLVWFGLGWGWVGFVQERGGGGGGGWWGVSERG